MLETGLWDLDDTFAPDPDGKPHYHTHNKDGLQCYGDTANSGRAVRAIRGHDDLEIVTLPYCIYPCHITNEARRDDNIAMLGEG